MIAQTFSTNKVVFESPFLWRIVPAEQGAAASLGYDESTWNAYAVRKPVGDIELFWSQFAWEELH